jgi:hypothetical protein
LKYQAFSVGDVLWIFEVTFLSDGFSGKLWRDELHKNEVIL